MAAKLSGNPPALCHPKEVDPISSNRINIINGTLFNYLTLKELNVMLKKKEIVLKCINILRIMYFIEVIHRILLLRFAAHLLVLKGIIVQYGWCESRCVSVTTKLLKVSHAYICLTKDN